MLLIPDLANRAFQECQQRVHLLASQHVNCRAALLQTFCTVCDPAVCGKSSVMRGYRLSENRLDTPPLSAVLLCQFLECQNGRLQSTLHVENCLAQ
jgi:hypothetical protein